MNSGNRTIFCMGGLEVYFAAKMVCYLTGRIRKVFVATVVGQAYQ